MTIVITGLSLSSCKKEGQPEPDKVLVGKWKWTLQYRGSPSNTLTPQNTGIEEIHILKNDNSWSTVQNGSTVDTGTFRTSYETNTKSDKVKSVYYHSNTSNRDFTKYYTVSDSTLMFSQDLMGTIGSGARVYVKIE